MLDKGDAEDGFYPPAIVGTVSSRQNHETDESDGVCRRDYHRRYSQRDVSKSACI